jgi:hypothetical protein
VIISFDILEEIEERLRSLKRRGMAQGMTAEKSQGNPETPR